MKQFRHQRETVSSRLALGRQIHKVDVHEANLEKTWNAFRLLSILLSEGLSTLVVASLRDTRSNTRKEGRTYARLPSICR